LLPGPPRIILRHPEEVEEHPLGLLLPRVLGPDVVRPVVVVVPGRVDRASGPQLDVAGLLPEEGILRPHHLHVLGVGVDVVPEEDEVFGLRVGDRVPDRLRPVLLGARPERDPGDRRGGGGRGVRREQPDECGE
jgi:hypothetical protein